MYFFQRAMTNLAYTPGIRDLSTQPQQAHFADATEAEFAVNMEFCDLPDRILRDLGAEAFPSSPKHSPTSFKTPERFSECQNEHLWHSSIPDLQ
jgi:hypothetical protein